MSRFFGSAPVTDQAGQTGQAVQLGQADPLPGPVPVLVLTGPVGVGKTSVGDAVGEILTQRGVGYAYLDLDQLRYSYPRPDDDPFHEQLGLANLAAIWPNYVAAGASCLVLPTVVESHAHITGITRAIPGSMVLVVRLHASLITIRERLQGRESGTSLTLHLQRTAKLIDVYERVQPEDILIDTEGLAVREIAERVTANWP